MNDGNQSPLKISPCGISKAKGCCTAPSLRMLLDGPYPFNTSDTKSSPLR